MSLLQPLVSTSFHPAVVISTTGFIWVTIRSSITSVSVLVDRPDTLLSPPWLSFAKGAATR